MHDLVTVNLTAYLVEEEEDGDSADDGEHAEHRQQFGDEDVRVLLQNNEKLVSVSLCGFPISSQSLQYFTRYVQRHGLQQLTIKSSISLSDDAVTQLAKTGAKNRMRQLAILSDDPEEDMVIRIKKNDVQSPVLEVVIGSSAGPDYNETFASLISCILNDDTVT